MVTEYKHKFFPYLTHIVLIVCGLLMIILTTLAIILDQEFNWFQAVCTICIILVLNNTFKQKSVTTIDEEQRIIFTRACKDSPVNIDEIRDISVKESKKGRYRGQLTLHTHGVRFMEIKSDKENAYRIIDHLKRLNPTIEVKSNTHII